MHSALDLLAWAITSHPELGREQARCGFPEALWRLPNGQLWAETVWLQSGNEVFERRDDGTGAQSVASGSP